MAKILVVDDRAANREYLVTLLGYTGHTILEAVDGGAAIGQVRAHHPDLVITDILMPAMDGYEFVRQLRADPSIGQTPVVFCTAHFLEPQARALAEACGVQRILSKPVEPATLLRTVEDLLGGEDHEPLTGLGTEFDREHLRLVTDKLSAKNDELYLTNLRLEALLETSCALASKRDPVVLIGEYCRAARHLCGARYASAGIAGPDGAGLRHFAASGYPPDIVMEPPSFRDTVFSGVMANVQTVRLQVEESNFASLGLSANHPPIRSLLVVPIVSGRRVQGFLCLADKIGAEEFDGADQKIAVSLAAQLSIFYENARLFEEVQRKAAELEANARKNAELERQFLQAQKMEAVGRLAGGVAHDFNNMLTVILGYNRMLVEDTNLSPMVLEAADEIMKAADRASALTRQLLAFSRSQILQPKALNLNESIGHIAKMLQRLIGEDVELVQMLAPELGQVRADPAQIDQIVMNLVVNARDAMPRGGKITIETRNVHLEERYTEAQIPVKPGDYVMLAVRDTGHGIDAATQSKLFEPFFTTKERGKGTGLGLSTVYGIVKQSGGNISVVSEPEKGAAFTIYLPRIFGDGAAPHAAPAAIAADKHTGTILVLEDELPLRRMAVKILRRAGHQVHDFGTPDSAIEFLSLGRPHIDLLLTDLVLPGMDGFHAAEEIIRVRPQARVLFMSGYTEHAVMRAQTFEEGTSFLAKPFTPKELVGKVEEVLALGHAR